MKFTFIIQKTPISILFCLSNLIFSCSATADKIKILKTPKQRFERLEGYHSNENHPKITPQLSMHYVDEGDKNAPVILLLHGEPSWLYVHLLS